MELTTQQQRIFSALKEGNAALKAAQAEVRPRAAKREAPRAFVLGARVCDFGGGCWERRGGGI